MCCSLQYLLPNLPLLCSLNTWPQNLSLFTPLRAIHLFYKAKGAGVGGKRASSSSQASSPPHQDEERAYAKAEDLNIDPLRTIHALFLWDSLHITLGYTDPSLRTADVKSIRKHTGTQNFKVQSTSAFYRGVNWAREMSKKSLLNKLTHILFTQQIYFLLWCKWVFLGFYCMLCRKN